MIISSTNYICSKISYQVQLKYEKSRANLHLYYCVIALIHFPPTFEKVYTDFTLAKNQEKQPKGGRAHVLKGYSHS